MQADNMEALRQLSTEQLDSMLHTELQKEDADPAEVRAILKVLEEREEDTPAQADDDDDIQAWRLYQSWVKEKSDRKVKQRNRILRAACIATVLCALSIAVVHDVEADTIWGRIARWTDSIIAFIDPDDPSVVEEEYTFRTEHPGLQQVYDSVTTLGVTDPVVPMWLPEGYELDFCQEMNTSNKTTVAAFFRNGESVINFNVAVYSKVVSNRHQKDETEVKLVEIQGVAHYITRNNSAWVAVWGKEKIECSLSIECQEDEIYRILRSIYD